MMFGLYLGYLIKDAIHGRTIPSYPDHSNFTNSSSSQTKPKCSVVSISWLLSWLFSPLSQPHQSPSLLRRSMLGCPNHLMVLSVNPLLNHSAMAHVSEITIPTQH